MSDPPSDLLRSLMEPGMSTFRQGRTNILHAAAKLAPPDRLNEISNPLLQMQGDLQWYERACKWAPPEFEYMENSQGKTPPVIFTEEHKDLLKEAERWTRHKATSFSAATLIVTIGYVAAAAFLRRVAGFPIFSVSNAITVFFSTVSLLTFMSFRTARYAEGDFLVSLPRRLVIGLGTLFLSTMSMAVSFCVAAEDVLHKGDDSGGWVFVAVAGFVFLPTMLILWSQCLPLLRETVRPTYF